MMGVQSCTLRRQVMRSESQPHFVRFQQNFHRCRGLVVVVENTLRESTCAQCEVTAELGSERDSA